MAKNKKQKEMVVEIEIRNGAAEVVTKSKGVKVVIMDYDNAELDLDDDKDYTDEEINAADSIPTTEEYGANEKI